MTDLSFYKAPLVVKRQINPIVGAAGTGKTTKFVYRTILKNEGSRTFIGVRQKDRSDQKHFLKPQEEGGR